MTAPILLSTRLALDTGEPLDGPATCAICGGRTERSHDIDDVCGSLTTDLPSFRAPHSRDVCPGCALVRGRSAHPPGRESGWWCNFSHFMDADRYENASKGEKPRILAWLRGPKVGAWWCVIADTGQKHLVCYAPLNPAGSRGRVRFEEADVALPSLDGWRVVDDLTALLTAGATKEEIETGRYTARAHTLCGDALRAFEREFGRLRGSAWFSLALWLSQRDEVAVAERLDREKQTKAAKKSGGKTPRKVVASAERSGDGAASDSHRGDDVGTPAELPANRAEHPQALDRPHQPNEVCGGEHVERGRVGDAGPAPTPDPATGQLGLFGALEPRRIRAGARRMA